MSEEEQKPQDPPQDSQGAPEHDPAELVTTDTRDLDTLHDPRELVGVERKDKADSLQGQKDE